MAFLLFPLAIVLFLVAAAGMTSTLTTVSQAQSLAAIRNFVRASVSLIAYARGLCHESSFESRQLLGLEVKTMVPSTNAAKSLLEFMETGAFDALSKGYLREMALCVLNKQGTSVLESYAFSFEYTSDRSKANMVMHASTGQSLQPSSLSMTYDGRGTSVPSPRTHCSKDEVRTALADTLLRLVDIIENLPPLLTDRTLSLRLTYNDESTPDSYEAPCFEPATKRVLQMYRREMKLNVPIGSADTSHHILGVSIRHPTVALTYAKLGREAQRPESGFTQASTCTTDTVTLPSTAPSLKLKQQKLLDMGRKRCRDSSSLLSAAYAGSADPADRSSRGVLTVDDASEDESDPSLSLEAFQTMQSLEDLSRSKKPFRRCELAYLLIMACAVSQLALSPQRRVRYHDVDYFLKHTCALELSGRWAEAALCHLTQEGYLKVAYPGGCPVTSMQWEICEKPLSALLSSLLKHQELTELLAPSTHSALKAIIDSEGKGSTTKKTTRSTARKKRTAALADG